MPDLSTMSDDDLQKMLQQGYDTLNQQGVFADPKFQQIGHSLRAAASLRIPRREVSSRLLRLLPLLRRLGPYHLPRCA